jgi:hypothetical protein
MTTEHLNGTTVCILALGENIDEALVADPGPRRHRRLETRLQPLRTLLPELPTPSPLRCHLYPPMNNSAPWTNSRAPATSRLR